MENGILFDPRDTKDPCQFFRLNFFCAQQVSVSISGQAYGNAYTNQ